MDFIKRQTDMIPKDECPQCATGKSGVQLRIAPERMKRLGQSRKDTELWICQVMEVKAHVVKNSIA